MKLNKIHYAVDSASNLINRETSLEEQHVHSQEVTGDTELAIQQPLAGMEMRLGVLANACNRSKAKDCC